ncbi:MAG: molybdenum ABC transporter ATP-binding protein [Hyphomicrobiaceae bacterium]
MTMTAARNELKFQASLARPKFAIDIDHVLRFDGIVALYGQNGSGKSTLLRILAGLEPAARGHIQFNGEIWQSADARTMTPAHKRGVGFVFQDPRLFTHLDVAGNLAYAAKRAVPAGGSNHRITHAAVVDALDLAPLLERSTTALSGGERQRVALGRALLSNPRLMFMDEPLSAIDNRRRHEILNYIARLPALFGIPTIYVTHALDEVVRLADHMMVLSHGKLAASGSVEDILERLDLAPATGRFEAGVLLRARVKAHDTTYHLTALEHAGDGGVTHTLWVPLVEAGPGTEVRLRIRARDVTLATAEPQGISTRNVLPGRLVEVNAEPDTAYAETLVDIGGSRLRARLTRKAAEELGLVPGARVYALIKSISLDRIVPLD